jgi:hypothetical protein
LTDRFAIGATGKYIQENLFNETSRGAAFDLGVVYGRREKLTLGAAITNFGTKLRLEGRDILFNEDPLRKKAQWTKFLPNTAPKATNSLTLRFGGVEQLIMRT